MYFRFFIAFIIFTFWIFLINIGNVYDFIDYFNKEVVLYDPLYPWTYLDHLMNYVDYIFLIYNSFINKHFFVFIIYLVMFFTFISQLYLFVYNKISNNHEAIEFNLNIPPLLGVMGTIYAFASLVASGDNIPDMIVVLKDNFNNAAMTTILGGITYVFNFLILVINEKLQKV